MAEIMREVNELLHDSSLKLAAQNAELAALERQYEDEYAHRIESHAELKHHPLVSRSIESNRCELCGACGEEVAQAITEQGGDLPTTWKSPLSRLKSKA